MAQVNKKPDDFKGGKLAKKLNAWNRFHMGFCRAGINASETNTPTQRAINVIQPVVSAAQDGLFPFKIITRLIDGAWFYGVIYNSLLFNVPSYIDTQTISGLFASDKPAVDDPGWIAWNYSEDIVWLEMDVADFTVSEAAIRSWSAGNEFGGGEVEDDGADKPSQTKSRVVIGKITVSDDDSGSPVIDQRVRTHLEMVPAIEESKDSTGGTVTKINCLVPMAYPGVEADPDWLQTYGTDGTSFVVVMGDSAGSFVNTSSTPAKINELGIQVGDWSDATFSLIVGDDDTTVDALILQGYGGGSELHSFGVHPEYLYFDAPKIFLGYDTTETETEYKFTLTNSSADHTIGLHGPYLDIDGGTNAFFGYDEDNSKWKCIISDEVVIVSADGSISIGDDTFKVQGPVTVCIDGVKYTMKILGTTPVAV